MKRPRRPAIIAIALCAAAAAPTLVFANVPDRDWPSVVPTPAVDVPMQDAAITRDPDGTYYLIGTQRGENAKGELDFDNGRQIKLWKSRDLKKWEEVGVVWDLAAPRGHYLQLRWMEQSHRSPDSPGSPVNRGIKAPKLHHIRGDWYICFSMNDQGTGLIKSSSGKPEGPYVAHAQITLRHGDPTIFWDEKDQWGGSDKVYWLFGGGWIGELNDDLTALVEQPRLLTTKHHSPPDWAARQGAPIYREHPLTVGTHGVFLFKNRGRYYLTAAERTTRLNSGTEDTFVAVADQVYGPYGERSFMIPHGGGVTIFRGPRSSAVAKYYYPQQAHFLHSVSKNAKPIEEVELAKDDPTFYAAFSGNDPLAVCKDRPTFIPLEWTGPERWQSQRFGDLESVPRKPQHVFTERGPWPWMKPLLPLDERFADIAIIAGPDGYHYFSGSAWKHPGTLFVWRSKDMARWEQIGPLWTYEQVEWIKDKTPLKENAYPANPLGSTDFSHVFWHAQVVPHKDTFYISYCIFANDEKNRGTGLLRSKTGAIEGPYESLGKVGGQWGVDPTPSVFEPFEWNGQTYAWDWIGWRSHVAKADFDVSWKDWKWQKVDEGVYGGMNRSDAAHVTSLDGFPLLVFKGTGQQDSKEAGGALTLDENYIVMETPRGPPRKDCSPRNIPHVKHGNLFKGHDGRFWASSYGSDYTGPWIGNLGLVPLRVERVGDNDILIEPEYKPDEYQKKIIGGGQIAEVLTVQETIK